MPKVGIAPSDWTSGGMFTFTEGRGEIVASTIVNHAIPGYPPTKCGYKLSIQRLNDQWESNGEVPVEEFLACGPVDKFHPGMADGPDDNSPDLEIGMGKDLGIEDGAEGNQLLSVSGAGPDQKSKSVVFVKSLVGIGIKHGLLTGYAPHLVGLKATFTQKMMEKGANYSGKNDPTNLIVGVGGHEAGAVVHQWPAAQGAAPTAAKPAAAGRAAAAPKPPAGQTAAPPVAPAPGIAMAPAPPAAAAGGGNGQATGDEMVEATALQLLVALAEGSAGQTVTRAKIGSKMVTLLAKNRVPTAQHKPIRALIDGGWFVEKVAECGWVLDPITNAVTFPVAAG